MPMQAQEGEGTTVLNHSEPRLWKVVGASTAPRPLYPRKDPVTMVQESGWDSDLIWTWMENLASPRFDSQTVQPIAGYYTD